MTILHELYENKLIQPPNFVVDNLCLLTHGGSFAYGCATNSSDFDLYGICIPDHKHLYGDGILGFDNIPTFNEYQQHHIHYNSIEYDIKIYSLPRIFKLAMDGNPNILDILATPSFAVMYENEIGKMLRQHKSMFFSKECVSKFLGFANNHIKSLQNRINSGIYPEGRKDLYEQYGYDTKDAAHCIRAILNIIDILKYGNYQLDKYSSLIKGIRNGAYSFDTIIEFYNEQKEYLKAAECFSSLQKHPDTNLIRSRLIYYINLWETLNVQN